MGSEFTYCKKEANDENVFMKHKPLYFSVKSCFMDKIGSMTLLSSKQETTKPAIKVFMEKKQKNKTLFVSRNTQQEDG